MRNIKTYLDILDQHRDEMALALMSDPGLSKTSQCKQWCEEHGRQYFEFITSQRMPSEISGMAMPDADTKRMKIYDFDYLLDMKDGDVLAFDEFTNGNIMTLNACLTLIQERNMMSGRKLPSILIVAMGNPQGKCDMLPQTKQRFLWLNVKFDEETWCDWIKKELNIVPTQKLINIIKNTYKSGFGIQDYNYMTARTVTNLLKLAKTVDSSNAIWRNMYGVDQELVNELYASVNNNQNNSEDLELLKYGLCTIIQSLKQDRRTDIGSLDEMIVWIKECKTMSDIKSTLKNIEESSNPPDTKTLFLERIKSDATENIADMNKLVKALTHISKSGGYSLFSIIELRSAIKNRVPNEGTQELLKDCLNGKYNDVGLRLYSYVIAKGILDKPEKQEVNEDV